MFSFTKFAIGTGHYGVWIMFLPIAILGACSIAFLEWWIGLENIEGEEG